MPAKRTKWAQIITTVTMAVALSGPVLPSAAQPAPALAPASPGAPVLPAAAQPAPEPSAVPPPAGECGTSFPDYDPKPVATESRRLVDQEIRMSDGVVLRADVTLPVGVDGPVPTALTITGYNKQADAAGFGASSGDLWRYGYAVMVVDDRGTGTSGGKWDSWGERTRADYPEVLDWIVAQPWSDGDVAMVGTSYMAITSLFAAATGHPAVKATFAVVPMGDAYRDIVFGGGQVNTAFIPLWMGLVTGLGLIPSTDPTTILEHLLGATEFQLGSVAESLLGGSTSYAGDFWEQRSPLAVADRIKAPTFILGGLDDLFQRGEPMLYEALAGHTDARLLIGPWAHIEAGRGLPRDGVPPVSTLVRQWFDAHVKGIDSGARCVPAVTQYVRGIERYQSAPTWPIPDLRAERWHLRGDGSLTPDAPTGPAAGRSYLQLPITGLCTRSTNQWLIGLLAGTPCASDNRLDEALSLTYTTAPFAEATRLDGPIQADLWLEAALGSEAVVSVAVSSVAPDGTSRGLTNGLQMASHRAVDESRARLLDGQSIQPWHLFTRAAQQPVRAGEPMLVPVEVFPTSAVVPAGHRLRVTVAAYDVPHALPPLPALLGTLAGPVTVLNDAAHPSSIVLPVKAATPAAPTTPETPAAPEAPATGGGVDATGNGRLAATGGPALPLAAAVAMLLLALAALRLRRPSHP